jgi:hypothetical protein
MSTNNGMDENQAPNSSRLSPRTRHPWPDLDAESTTSDPFSNAHAVNVSTHALCLSLNPSNLNTSPLERDLQTNNHERGHHTPISNPRMLLKPSCQSRALLIPFYQLFLLNDTMVPVAALCRIAIVMILANMLLNNSTNMMISIWSNRGIDGSSGSILSSLVLSSSHMEHTLGTEFGAIGFSEEFKVD